MKKSNLLPAIVLSSICVVVALLLAVVNTFTAPEIAKNKKEKEIKALQEVLPAGTYFDPIEITEAYPDVITGGYKSDAGFVFKMEVVGYKSGLVIMCGVDADGKIVGVKHVQTSETYGFEGQLNGAYVGKDSDSLEFVIATGATKNSKTSSAYYSAMNAALEAYKIASGKVTYPGVESVEVNENGEYVIVAYGIGYSGKITIEISIDASGKIIYTKTLSQSETPDIGGAALKDPAFHDKFVGIGKDDVDSVANHSGATLSSNGFKEAVSNAFAAFEAINSQGGNE